jgi:hypothetical protein
MPAWACTRTHVSLATPNLRQHHCFYVHFLLPDILIGVMPLPQGSVIVRVREPEVVKIVDGTSIYRSVSKTKVLHVDIIGDDFWKEWGILEGLSK